MQDKVKIDKDKLEKLKTAKKKALENNKIIRK